MSDFKKDAFVKVVGISGNYHYGYISDVREKGFSLVICLHDEGASALEYEATQGVAPDWDKMLSETEKQIIPLLAQNMTTNEVATEMSLSPITIRAHIRTLRLKLQLENRQQVIAFSQGLEHRLDREKNE